LSVRRYLLLGLLLPLTALATPIFYSTNGTTTPTSTPGGSWVASTTVGGAVVSVEMQFSSGLTGVLDSIVAPLSASVSDVTFLLRSDAAGFAGAVMDTFTFHAVTATLQLLTASSTNHPTLNAGTTYWLEALAPISAGNDSINWYFTSPPVMGTVEVENPIPAVLTGQQISAFAVLGADVPEPSTLWTVALLLALLTVIHRRR
jgi:hypothetical protein